MRFLFATVQGFESEFYGRVGRLLEGRGHEVRHLTVSRRAAAALRRAGADAVALTDLVPRVAPLDLNAERARIEVVYGPGTIRDLWSTDPPCAGRPPAWCDDRVVRHVLAIEGVFDHFRPDVVVPEVGVELIRTAAETVARARGITILFLFYTIFPRPLRLYANTMQAPIVEQEDVRPLTEVERREVDRFVADFTRRRLPIRAHRNARVTRRRIRRLSGYIAGRVGRDRDNPYLRPGRWLIDEGVGLARRVAAPALYRRVDRRRPYVYFPLHAAEDYKIRRLLPHLADQSMLIERLAASLPDGHEVVVKEHPLAIGRTSLRRLRRLARFDRVRLVRPRESTHDLVDGAAAVAVIGSTVGLEALLYGKPVLTIGRPFYAGFGVTVDIDTPEELERGVFEVFRFRPDRERIARFLHAAMRRCLPGAPVLVDDTDENAQALAMSLDTAVREQPGRIAID